ncbi:MAG: hypothetical protein UH850_10455 [Paludibacteraceae bacterium]|nr:hypothetical protein [Paludibacteraceae bacterium]
METKNITVRIPSNIAEWLDGRDNSYNGAIVDALEKAMFIESYSMDEIKGKLTEQEWKYLADSLNGTLALGSFRYSSSVLAAGVEDSDRLDGLGSKWGVDVKVLTEKILALTAAQIDAIYTRVEDFWNNPKMDLNVWAKY